MRGRRTTRPATSSTSIGRRRRAAARPCARRPPGCRAPRTRPRRARARRRRARARSRAYADVEVGRRRRRRRRTTSNVDALGGEVVDRGMAQRAREPVRRRRRARRARPAGGGRHPPDRGPRSTTRPGHGARPAAALAGRGRAARAAGTPRICGSQRPYCGSTLTRTCAAFVTSAALAPAFVELVDVERRGAARTLQLDVAGLGSRRVACRAAVPMILRRLVAVGVGHLDAVAARAASRRSSARC